jgi:hypothetical protein
MYNKIIFVCDKCMTILMIFLGNTTTKFFRVFKLRSSLLNLPQSHLVMVGRELAPTRRGRTWPKTRSHCLLVCPLNDVNLDLALTLFKTCSSSIKI